MTKSAISGFDRRSALPTRAHPQLGAFCLKDLPYSVVVEGTLPIGVEYLGRSGLRPARMMRI
eukprot:9483311-Pyramimonas_sp.AAC.1